MVQWHTVSTGTWYWSSLVLPHCVLVHCVSITTSAAATLAPLARTVMAASTGTRWDTTGGRAGRDGGTPGTEWDNQTELTDYRIAQM